MSNNRKILLDLETTGLSKKNNRIIEIALVEIVDNIETGNIYQSYVNPLMPIGQKAKEITKITDDMVKDAPQFYQIVEEILTFIGNSPIIAHNASFDIGFMNMELEKIKLPKLNNEVIDTLTIARSLYKNNNSLDALCKRFGINLDDRKKYGHGALLDCHLLGQVYHFLIHEKTGSLMDFANEKETEVIKYDFPQRETKINNIDKKKHEEFCKKHNIEC